MTNIIWDLDGTLIDSYTVIVSSLKDAFQYFGINLNYENIFRYVKDYTVSSFIFKTINGTDICADEIWKKYFEYNNTRKLEIDLIENAKFALQQTHNKGILHYIYTHKNATTFPILEHLDIRKYFTEIITIENGFQRKPAPDAINYLVKKYNLDRESTYYIGDRLLDIECAYNAGIKSILYLPKESNIKSNGKEDYIVNDLLEILDIL